MDRVSGLSDITPQVKGQSDFMYCIWSYRPNGGFEEGRSEWQSLAVWKGHFNKFRRTIVGHDGPTHLVNNKEYIHFPFWTTCD